MEYIYIEKVGNYVIDVFHSQDFDYNFVRKLLDRDTKSIVEVYTRTNTEYPLSILFICSLN